MDETDLRKSQLDECDVLISRLERGQMQEKDRKWEMAHLEKVKDQIVLAVFEANRDWELDSLRD